MKLETSCPICAYKNVAADAKQCPQCDSDLTSFRVLESLPDELALVSDESRVRKRVTPPLGMTLAIILLLVIVSGVFAYVLVVFEARLQRQRARLAGVETRLHEALASLRIERRDSPSNSRPERRGVQGERADTNTRDQAVADSATVSDRGPSKKAPRSRAESRSITRSRHYPRRPSRRERSGDNETGFFVYHPSDDDTLWGIARRFYGAGQLYPVLLEHNPNLEIHRIRSGLKIQVLQDAQAATALFKDITEIEGGKLYWRYTVQAGDTLESIAKKFYGPGSSTEPIVRDNLRNEIAVGHRIKVRVD
ncbi:MAG: LysM peptidoglycan-binding domain-containing protein [Deltaproteobacteria bacterium]|nr:LysM peptidoglycan-binding domain-containing protein [Deltaproteobacteria bacterium]